MGLEVKWDRFRRLFADYVICAYINKYFFHIVNEIPYFVLFPFCCFGNPFGLIVGKEEAQK